MSTALPPPNEQEPAEAAAVRDRYARRPAADPRYSLASPAAPSARAWISAPTREYLGGPAHDVTKDDEVVREVARRMIAGARAQGAE